MGDLRYLDGRPAEGPMLSVAAHQPGYHRHLYYYAKMAAADVFVSLDTVQYVTREWQNRQAFWYAGRRRWLTVPVRQGREPLRDKKISDHRAIRNHWRVLSEIYRNAPYFGWYERDLAAVYETGWDRLIDLCDALDAVVTRGLGITTERLRASDLLPDSRATRGRLLAELALEVRRRACRPAAPVGYVACAAPMRADHYLRRRPAAGSPSELEVMHNLGVEVVTFSHRHPVYHQHQMPRGHPFEPELSAIDLLFNHGPDARAILSAPGAARPGTCGGLS
jgi:WbqC-like protein family